MKQLSYQDILDYAKTYAPRLRFYGGSHADFSAPDPYLPCNVEFLLGRSTLHAVAPDGSVRTVEHPEAAQLAEPDVGPDSYLKFEPAALDPVPESEWKTYVHVIKASETDLEIQYLWVYAFNGGGVLHISKGVTSKSKEVDSAPIGEHWGDWERVTVRIRADDGAFLRAYMSSHTYGSWYLAADGAADLSGVELVEHDGQRQVVAYPAFRSHAGYNRVGNFTVAPDAPSLGNDFTRLVKWFAGTSLVDITDAAGIEWDTTARLEVVEVDPRLGVADAPTPPDWLKFQGRWGETLTQRLAFETVSETVQAVASRHRAQAFVVFGALTTLVTVLIGAGLALETIIGLLVLYAKGLEYHAPQTPSMKALWNREVPYAGPDREHQSKGKKVEIHYGPERILATLGPLQQAATHHCLFYVKDEGKRSVYWNLSEPVTRDQQQVIWRNEDTLVRPGDSDRIQSYASPSATAIATSSWARIYLFWVAENSQIFYSWYEGSSWVRLMTATGQVTGHSPAVATMGGRIYLAYQTTDGFLKLVRCGPSDDGQIVSWTTVTAHDNTQIYGSPSLAARDGELFVAYQSAVSGNMSVQHYGLDDAGELELRRDLPLGDAFVTKQAPGAVVVDGVLTLLYPRGDDDKVRFAQYDEDRGEWVGEIKAPFMSGHSMGLAASEGSPLWVAYRRGNDALRLHTIALSL